MGSRENSITELEILEDWYPGGLDRVLAAIRGGQIYGGSYDFCVVGQALGKDVSWGKKVSTAEDLLKEVYGEEAKRDFLEIEILVMGVERGQTDCFPLQVLKEYIEEVLSDAPREEIKAEIN